MPDLGIGEAIGGLADLFGGGDLLAGLFGGGTAAADTAAAAGTAAEVGTVADLAGPTALGTAGAFLDPAAAAAGSAGLGPTFAGTIADTLGPAAAAGAGGTLAGTFGAAPAALDSSVFSTGTSPVFNSSGLSDVVGGAGGALPSSPISSMVGGGAPTPTGAGGTSVFNTGSSPITGLNSTTGTAAPVVPGGGGAAGAAAPSSVTAPADATAAGATPGTAGSTGSAAAQQPSTISQLLSKAGNSITSNPLSVGLGAAGLGYNIYAGQKQTANTAALSSAAQQAANTSQTALNAGMPIAEANNATGTQLTNTGEALQTYLQNGTLPPAYQAQVDQAISSAITNAKSNAAAQGLSTDPTQNTALAATIAGIQNQGPQLSAQLAQQLFSAGSTDIAAGTGESQNSAASLLSAGQGAAGLSGSLYQSLVQNDTQAAANTGKAIAALAASLNGKTQANAGGTTITLG